jgi:hypothetical protein
MTATLPPPPPPPPPPGAADGGNWRDLKRADRARKRAEIADKAKRVHPSWWKAGGAIVAVAVTAVGCRQYQADQRAANEALARIAAPTATSQPQPRLVGIPNPLEELKLTPAAAQLIGAGTDGQMYNPVQSAKVIAQMIGTVDACAWWVSVDPQFNVALAREPKPGYVPLVDCRKDTASSTTSTTKPAMGQPTPTTVKQGE